jgi:hypothetical protein
MRTRITIHTSVQPTREEFEKVDARSSLLFYISHTKTKPRPVLVSEALKVG